VRGDRVQLGDVHRAAGAHLANSAAIAARSSSTAADTRVIAAEATAIERQASAAGFRAPRAHAYSKTRGLRILFSLSH
jgi:hypothetical protein